MKLSHKSIRMLCGFVSAFLLLSCSSSSEPKVEIYEPATRQLPLEPVYGRVMWSHLPKPIGPKVNANAPFLKKTMEFDLPNSNLEESVVALAHSVGYDTSVPKHLAKRRVSVKTEGTTEEILDKICEQANVFAEIDRSERRIRVVEKGVGPTLP